MTTFNRDRALVRILREIAAERGIDMVTFSHDWILRLQAGPTVRHVYGYDFELNSAAAQLIADDKSAVSDLLAHSGVPHVEHRLVMHPKLAAYAPLAGNWPDLLEFARRCDGHVVCKSNNGTGGREVFRAESQLELELAVQRLFETNRTVCVSPFYSFDHEYRLIVLDGTCELAYAKCRPTVVGDGQTTIAELILAGAKSGAVAAPVAARALQDNDRRLADVLGEGEALAINWRHNLGQGSRPEPVADAALLGRLEELALRCTAVLGLRFASVDVVEVAGRHLVLEVNAGIMMESYATASPESYATARRIYSRAVDLLFATQP